MRAEEKINSCADDISPRQKHLLMISIRQHAESEKIADCRHEINYSYCQYDVYLAQLAHYKHYWMHEIQNIKRMHVEKVVILDQK